MVDMAHFAGLVAAGLHPSPMPYADVVTTTTHKTLGGPRGGVILCKTELAKRFNSAVFPGQQGGPLEHVVAAKAVRSRSPRAKRSPSGSSAPWTAPASLPTAPVRRRQRHLRGTDVHLVLVDLRGFELDGQQAED